MLAEEAYESCLRMDRTIALLSSAANDGKTPDELETLLSEYHIQAPSMPKTTALLASIPAEGSHPGAQYRLAGDR